MNRKTLACVIALVSAVVTVAQAMEAAATGSGRTDPRSFMPPALRTPEADPAVVRLVWQAVLTQFPEIVDDPERSGIFVVAIALRPDGSVVRSGMRYAEQESDVNANQQALRDLMPKDVNAISGMADMAYRRKGATVLDDRVLKGTVRLDATMVPSNWDETRDSGLVQRAVIQRHADLFLPRSSDHINQLTVAMNEKGEIVGERVETLTVEHQGTMSRVTSGCRLPSGAGDFATFGISPQEGAAIFAGLGLAADQVGLAGSLSASLPVNQAAVSQSPRLAVGADGIARGALPVSDLPVLRVCYAWPRRPGEPVGGTPLAWDSIPRPRNEVPSQMRQVNQLVEQYFPSGSPADGNWMLLTYNGEVLRTGHVELGKGEYLTGMYVERMLPGIKVRSSMGTTRAVSPKAPGEMPHETINVNVFFLAPDSPLPPAENVAAPTK